MRCPPAVIEKAKYAFESFSRYSVEVECMAHLGQRQITTITLYSYENYFGQIAEDILWSEISFKRLTLIQFPSDIPHAL